MGSQEATVVDLELLRGSIAEVRDRVGRASRRAGRSPDDVMIVAVTKGFPVEVVQAAVDCGLTVFGENRVQEARAKIPLVDRKGVSWHLVGPLQRNKVKYCFDLFELIHSVDSMALADEIERQAEARDRTMEILLEVNVAGEASKHGAAPEEALALAQAVGRLERVRVVGLMAMPPLVADPEANRAHFRALRLLRDEIAGARIDGVEMVDLSMGMSGDFEVAIEEGATIVRIGTALFGPREA